MATTILEKPFHDAIAADQINGMVMEGRSVSGGSYSSYIGQRIAPDSTAKPLDPSSMPYMASATKLLATIAALQLVDRGDLSLDKDLRPALPKLTAMGVLQDFDSDTGATTNPLTDPLTLRQMLTHTAGMDYSFFNPLRNKYRSANPPPVPAPNQMERFLMPATYQPGQGWMYGHGMDFAAYLVEQRTGERLDEYLRKNIFAPVGISRDGISFFPIREGLGDRMPDLSPQDPEGLGLAAVGGFNSHDGGDVCYGGHGAYVTARAYVAVLESLMRNDEKILSRAMVEEMFRPQLDGKAYQSLQAALSGPGGSAFGCDTSGKGRNMGLGGLVTGEDGDGELGKGSLIWGGGHNTVWFIDRKNGICGTASPQLSIPGNVTVAMELKSAFRTHLRLVLASTQSGGGEVFQDPR
ncbi:hypothetical protein LTR86_000174 [Recurvomyces mirabilis]|nr:hypothetical protein LTR86_000174 [Recurvomyces mirabilis]